MKKYKFIANVTLVVAFLFSFNSCRDDFADLNQDPSAVTTGNPSYLFAQGILEFEPSSYTYWFYNANGIYQWAQLIVSYSGGVTSTIAEGVQLDNFRSIDMLKYANELKFVRSNMSAEESAQYEQYAACLDILCVYMGIFDSDFIGDIPYTEGAQAAHGGTLTPGYDRVENLYELWLSSLDNDIHVLTTATDQVFEATQDPIYHGNVDRWAKLANSLKLKLAARMINIDRSKALNIVQAVVSSSVGVLDGKDDDFLFNKATSHSSNSDYVYHWENDVLRQMMGSETIINFMIDNRDPRVRFLFRKNHFNSKVVQAFFNAKRHNDVPKYIMDNMDYEIGSDGIYRFKGWTGAGEPWVRYYGGPLAFNAAQYAGTYGDWFSYETQCKLDDKIYYPWSEFQKEMIHGRINFTLPVAPGDAVIQDQEDVPWWGMYLTTAEVNLYLAEFKLLGANLPGTAESYFNKALEASVREYDRLAANNKIPYYGTTYNYDPNEKVIDLQEGEIAAMMSNSDYQLTGDKASDLEKVYIQQILHFGMLPVEVYTTARRSGVPVINSTLFPRIDYASNNVPASSFPRRSALTAPDKTDLMFNVLTQSYEVQGYSVGSANGILNSQRTWQDKNNPQWGQGPIF